MRKCLVDGLAASVHDHRVHADDLEQHDIAHNVSTESYIHHRRAAVLDNDRLAGQVLDPRQGLEQELRRFLGGRDRARFICEFHGSLIF